MDFALEMAGFLEQFSARYLLRHNSALKCNCIDPVTQDAKPNCLDCGSSGQRYSLASVTAVQQQGSQADSYPFLMHQTDLGRVSVPAFRFYFPPGTSVQTGDEIWEVEWQGDLPINVLNVYRLAHVDVRVEGGRPQMMRGFGHSVPYNLKIARFTVKTQAGLKVYEPSFGRGQV